MYLLYIMNAGTQVELTIVNSKSDLTRVIKFTCVIKSKRTLIAESFLIDKQFFKRKFWVCG